MTDDVEEVEDLEELPEVEETEAPEDIEARREIEETARKYGWKPLAEFKGDAKGWRDADSFLDTPFAKWNMLKDEKRDLERTLREQNDKLSRVEATTRLAIDRVRAQERQQYEDRIRQIETAKRQAVETADTEAFDRLSRMQNEIAPPQDLAAHATPRVDPLSEYKASDKGKWLNDPQAAAFAFQLVENNPHVKALPPMKQATWAEQQVAQFFPEYFPAQTEAPRKASRVDGGGVGVPIGRRGKGASDLPADVRKVADSLVKEGIYSSAEEYAKDYFNPEING